MTIVNNRHIINIINDFNNKLKKNFNKEIFFLWNFNFLHFFLFDFIVVNNSFSDFSNSIKFIN